MSNDIAAKVQENHSNPESLDTEEKFIQYVKDNPIKSGIATSFAVDEIKKLTNKAWPIFKKLALKRVGIKA